MTIRFLQTAESENPDCPFYAGQVIRVACPSPYLQGLIDGVRAEVVPEDDTERAVVEDALQPEPVKVKGRRRARA